LLLATSMFGERPASTTLFAKRSISHHRDGSAHADLDAEIGGGADTSQ